MFARTLSLILLVGCYQSSMGDHDAGVIPDVADRSDGTDGSDTALDAPPRVEVRFDNLIGAQYDGDTWFLASGREVVTEEPTPLHLYRPDYSGERVRFGEPILLSGTDGWEISAAARWQDTLACVISRNDNGAVLIYTPPPRETLSMVPLEHEGSGPLDATIAMGEDAIYVISSWASDLGTLYERVPFGDSSLTRDSAEMESRTGDVPLAVVDGEPRIMFLRDRALFLAAVEPGGGLNVLREFPEGRSVFANGTPVIFSSGEREILVDGNSIGSFSPGRYNRGPSVYQHDAGVVVAFSIDDGIIKWAYQPGDEELVWNFSPTAGVSIFRVSHVGQGHAGVFYLDTPSEGLPQILYDGVRTE